MYEQTMGELGIQILAAGGETPQVDIPGIPADWPHADVAAGWGGDRLRMYENETGQWLITWETAWDTGTDASEFAARIRELAATFAGPVRVDQSHDSLRVRIDIASDEELTFDCCRL
jgi:hypothetical protein